MAVSGVLSFSLMQKLWTLHRQRTSDAILDTSIFLGNRFSKDAAPPLDKLTKSTFNGDLKLGLEKVEGIFGGILWTFQYVGVCSNHVRRVHVGIVTVDCKSFLQKWFWLISKISAVKDEIQIRCGKIQVVACCPRMTNLNWYESVVSIPCSLHVQAKLILATTKNFFGPKPCFFRSACVQIKIPSTAPTQFYKPISDFFSNCAAIFSCTS